MKPCCSPARPHNPSGVQTKTPNVRAGEDVRSRDIVGIPGGIALVGTDTPFFVDDGEGPLRRKRVASFEMDRTTVTNARFAAFVEASGHVTDAERHGDSLVFQGLLPKGTPPSRAVAEAPWWRVIPGASWRAPLGPDSEDTCLPDHPVTHVSYRDAIAFAKWAGGRLPSETEWEHAARGGLGDVPFPWGDKEPNDRDHQPCNIWQGPFPHQDLALDGYAGTAPARSFTPNGYGLFNMIGNVWELTSDPFKVRSLKKAVKSQHAHKRGFRLSKGGSFLCHRSYCYRYRIAARNSTSPDTSTSHQGFRLAYDP